MNTIIKIIRSILQDFPLFVAVAGMVLYSGFRSLGGNASASQPGQVPVINVSSKTTATYAGSKELQHNSRVAAIGSVTESYPAVNKVNAYADKISALLAK